MEKQSFSYDYVQLSPQEQIGTHSQPSWELSFVVVGSGIRFIGDTTESFQSGEIVLIPPGIPHCWYFDGNDTDVDGKIENIRSYLRMSFWIVVRPLFRNFVDVLSACGIFKTHSCTTIPPPHALRLS